MITICHTFGDISTSGFGGYFWLCVNVALFVDIFFQFVVVENFAFAARITRILTLEALSCVSQRERKISK